MPFTPVETSAIVAFVSFTDIARDHPANSTTHYFDLEENADAKNAAHKFQKNIGIHLPLEKKVEAACIDHHHPDLYYPLIFSFSQSLQNILLTTAHNGSGIMRDILKRDDNAFPYFTLKIKRADFIDQTRQALKSSSEESASYNLYRKMELAKTIFDVEPKHDLGELRALKALAATVDTFKNATPHLRLF